jgi:hypothetical protein
MTYIRLIPFCFFLVACSTKPQEEQVTIDTEETSVIEGKRAVPKTVSPIINGKVKYVASLNEIIALDTESEIELWRKIIYEISYDENLERDVQDIFIDSIRLADNSVIIRNESNNWYFLELDSKKVYPNYSEIQNLKHQGYALSFIDSYETEFQHYKNSDSIHKQLIKEQCLEQNLLSETSTHELNLKLSNGQFFTLKKNISDEQFYGYSFQYFDPITNLYVIWENWLEAGHPIAVNANSGKVIEVFGKTFSTNLNETLTANFANDLGSGWTPNGVQLLNIRSNEIDKLFEFDPIELLNENLGPVDLVWKNDSTVIIQFIKEKPDGTSSSIYKQMHFEEQKN